MNCCNVSFKPIAARAFSRRFKTVFFSTVVNIGLACFALQASAADAEYPAEWFEPAKKASELGITSFSQSPVLDNQDLPPVGERLPDDPFVSVPLHSIGSYGGTARIIAEDIGNINTPEGPLTVSPDHKTILPNIAESWSYSADGRELTVILRKGLRWSDGHPMTSEDFLFSINDLQLNSAFQPNTPTTLIGVALRAIDETTLVFSFEGPNPFFINYMAQSPELFIAPKHYFSQYHPDYTDPDEIAEKLEEIGYVNWATFITVGIQRRRTPQLVNQPTMGAFIPTEITPSMNSYVRNPYYFKIDPTGQQLPYVDAIAAEDVRDNAIAVAKASTGQLDFSGIRMPTQDIPLLKLGEQNSGIKVKIWRRLHGSDLVIQTNLNYPDLQVRALFQDVRFRRALSIAMNRDEMNDIIYFGRGVPRQVTVIPESDYFEPEFATAYTEFDPDKANLLLDQIRLFDSDGDGFREHTDGSPLTLTVEYVDTETPKQISMELVASYWQAVGIDARLKLIDRTLQYARAIANELEMTVWHADRTTDVLFPINPDFWVPRKLAASLSTWSEWSRWYISEGNQGEEPPAEVQQLQQWADQLATSMDPEERVDLGKKILASNAENVWTIGTVGLAPQPVVVSDRLKNVVDQGYWGWDIRWTMPYHTATWYIEE